MTMTRGELLLERLDARDEAWRAAVLADAGLVQKDEAADLAAAVKLIEQAQTANPALSIRKDESNPAWVEKSMSTKEAIWSQIQEAAAKDPATNGMGITVEQAISKFLSTPAGSKLYDAWVKAPWDAGGPVQKAENSGAPRGSSQVRRSAADEATLTQMGIDALAGK
jgi:hypothetical protein